MSAFTADSAIRRKHGGLTKTGGGTGGSYAFLLHAEGGVSLLSQPNGPRTLLQVWATDQVAPEHKAARVALLDELDRTIRPDEDVWEAANDIGRRRALTTDTWVESPETLPRARAAAELQMISQARMHAEGGFIQDLDCRVNWAATFLPEDADTFMEKMNQVFPKATSHYDEQLRQFHRQQPPGWIARQIHGIGGQEYTDEIFDRVHDPVPAAPILDHLDSLVESGITHMDDFEYKTLNDENGRAFGYLHIKNMHRARVATAALYDGVDHEKLAVGTPAAEKWTIERTKTINTKQALIQEAVELNAKLPRDRKDQAVININTSARWGSLDQEVKTRARLAKIETELAAAEQSLKRSSKVFPHVIDFETIKPGTAGFIDGLPNRIMKVNPKTVTDENGNRHSRDKVWYVSNK